LGGGCQVGAQSAQPFQAERIASDKLQLLVFDQPGDAFGRPHSKSFWSDLANQCLLHG
jgi:hypothetical protein